MSNPNVAHTHARTHTHTHTEIKKQLAELLGNYCEARDALLNFTQDMASALDPDLERFDSPAAPCGSSVGEPVYIWGNLRNRLAILSLYDEGSYRRDVSNRFGDEDEDGDVSTPIIREYGTIGGIEVYTAFFDPEEVATIMRADKVCPLYYRGDAPRAGLQAWVNCDPTTLENCDKCAEEFWSKYIGG